MVLLSNVLKNKRVVRTFIDSLRLTVKGGTGGNGLPKYGGVGGQGGNVCCVAKEGVSLKNVIKIWPTQRVTAGHGGNSHAKRILGEPGANEVIEVPVGVTIYRDDGRMLGDLNQNGSSVVVAKGGYGGSHRSGFLGVKGQSYVIRLDLKLIADIALVGFPNAGKSTFLRAVSKAKPKVASYPFTTIQPTIGIMEYRDMRSISVADLPGLIEGAHSNIGMGHKFLKHVERTKMLLFVVDINGFQLSPKHQHRSCLETIILLNKELELYKKEVLEKPATLIINKMDLPDADKKYDQIKDEIKNLKDIVNNYPEEMRPEKLITFDDMLPISAKYGQQDIKQVKQRLRELLDLNAELVQKEQLNEDFNLLSNLKEKVQEKTPGSKNFHV